MGKKNKAAAQRAKKKHQKEQKRQRKIAAEKQRRIRRENAPPAWLRGADDFDPWAPFREGIDVVARREGVHPQAVLRVALEDADDFDDEVPEGIWTPLEVGMLDDSAILAKLERLDVHVDQAGFMKAASELRSAWRVVNESWLAAVDTPIEPLDHNFLGIAAWCLWQRWCRELPSLERVIDQLEDGYDSVDDGHFVEATERWIDFWNRLKAFLTPEVRTLAAAQELVGTPRELSDWLVNMTSAAVEAREENPELVARAIKLVEEVLEQFAEEGPPMRIDVAEDLGALLFAAGRPEDGERVFRELIADDPDDPFGYVALADALAPEGQETRAGVERALALLDEAAARSVEDGLWDLARRVEHLQRLLDTLTPPAEGTVP